ncbi:cellulose synthase subunit BcsC-related outer membrane protein [Paraferrimonas sp. SM1919]|uniref:cellulose synthase subunit BcsC-related outer membrane protein n=1 Tax=Paraferrimonas sp. SM1919 TaxID=2662263 RepID=UPI0013D756E1|nr:cellulose synthase subunit BcsC-related outer membrane protein [Paraferrimonas sp. SM1919]
MAVIQGWISSIAIMLFIAVASVPAQAQSELAHLLASYHYWQGQDNSYYQSQVINKIAKIDSEHPKVLEHVVLGHIENQQFAQANEVLLKLSLITGQQQLYQELNSYLQFASIDKTIRTKLKLFERQQQHSKQLEIYQQVVTSEALYWPLALDYWPLLLAVDATKLALVIDKLEQLSLRYPTNERVQIRYLKVLINSGRVQQADFEKLKILANNQRIAAEVLQVWQSALLQMPYEPTNDIHYLQYIQRFPQDNFVKLHFDAEKSQYKKQQELLKIPQYHAKLRALDTIANPNANPAQLQQAINQLKYAQGYFREDEQILGNLARAYSKIGDANQALALYRQAISLNGENISTWQAQYDNEYYWSTLATAKQQINLGLLTQARQTIDLVSTMDELGIEHKLVLARWYQANGQNEAALNEYFQLLLGNEGNQRVLTNYGELLAQVQGSGAYYQWYNSLSLSSQRQLQIQWQKLKAKELIVQAHNASTKGNDAVARATLKQALAFDNNPWTRYDLAKRYIDNQQWPKAKALYLNRLHSVDDKYSYAQLLSYKGDYRAALKQFADINKHEFSQAMRDNQYRIQRLLVQQQLDKEQANKITMVQNFKTEFNWSLEQTAFAYQEFGLSEQANTLWLQLLEADTVVNNEYALSYLETLSNPDKQQLALARIERAQLTDKQRLRLITWFIEQAQDGLWQVNQPWLWQTLSRVSEPLVQLKAYQRLKQLPQLFELLQREPELANNHSIIRQVNRWLLAQPAQVKANLGITREWAAQYQNRYPVDPIGYELQALVAAQAHETKQRLKYLRQALDAAMLEQLFSSQNVQISNLSVSQAKQIDVGLLPLVEQQQLAQSLVNNLLLSKSTTPINRQIDHWYVNKLDYQYQKLAQQQQHLLEIGWDHYAKEGVEGLANVTLNSMPIFLTMPVPESLLINSRWFLGIEPTIIDSGVLQTNAPQSGRFGTLALCQPQCRAQMLEQKSHGYSLSLGVEAPNWRADLGTTPLGFATTDWLGGVEYDGDWGDLGWSLSASKRQMTSSNLAFAGSRDPNSSIFYGAVKRAVLGLSLSYDQGEGYGFWSVLDHGLIFGENIKNNYRDRIMIGGYYQAYDSEPVAMSLGVSTMAFKYRYNLSEFTLGQGAYWSPQQYSSVSLPVDFYGRIKDFSYRINSRISWSRSASEDSLYYPHHAGFQDSLMAKAPGIVSSSKGTSIGYGFNVNAEYKVSKHISLGAALVLQKSEFYAPNKLSLYLRYYFDGNQTPVNRPPKPITPYMDF